MLSRVDLGVRILQTEVMRPQEMQYTTAELYFELRIWRKKC